MHVLIARKLKNINQSLCLARKTFFQPKNINRLHTNEFIEKPAIICKAEYDVLKITKNQLMSEASGVLKGSFESNENKGKSEFIKTLNLLDCIFSIKFNKRRHSLINLANDVNLRCPEYENKSIEKILEHSPLCKLYNDKVDELMETAGYKRIKEEKLLQCFAKQRRTDHFKIKSNLKNYKLTKVWVLGEKRKDEDIENKFSNPSDRKKSKGAYQETVVSAFCLSTNAFVLTSLNDVFEDHFHRLLPKTRVALPTSSLVDFYVKAVFGAVIFYAAQRSDNASSVAIGLALLAYGRFVHSQFLSEKRQREAEFMNALHDQRLCSSIGVVSHVTAESRDRSLKRCVLVYLAALKISKDSGEKFSMERLCGEANKILFAAHERNETNRGNVSVVNYQREVNFMIRVGMLQQKNSHLMLPKSASSINGLLHQALISETI